MTIREMTAHPSQRSGEARPSVAGSALQRKCCDGHTPAEGQCDRCRDEHLSLQRSSSSSTRAETIPEIVEETLRSPGQPLSEETRSFFEPRFGRDFSHVRLHTDPRAAASARAVHADAYTVARHIVLGANGFEIDSPKGRALVAHELTHVIQQESTSLPHAGRPAIDPDPSLEAQAERAGHDVGAHGSKRPEPTQLARPAIQRQPTGGSKKAAPHITEVRVDQQAQRVNATFSDGTTVGDQCSTGKGHCCFDAASGMAEGGACSEANSTQVGNNCTPVGSWVVTAKSVSPNLPKWWTQFHDAKSVALHQYRPVDGTPLSHGCVRLNDKTAQTIFEGARERVTKVIVSGTAKPRCEHPNLQSEWENDFRNAGEKPPDGEQVNFETGKKYTKAEIARSRRHIEETREELRSGLGVTDKQLDTEIAAVGAGSPVASRIPRCVPSLTTEEQKVPSARPAGLVTAAATAAAAKLSKALGGSPTAAAAEKVVRATGLALWQSATGTARGGSADDRQLYWTRLMLSTAIRQFKPAFRMDTDTERRLRAKLLEVLEQTSRGMTGAVFPRDQDKKRILASGFDPFGFAGGGGIEQGNLSGAAALALDGEILTEGPVSGRVESVVYPVRYRDFDTGMIENFLRPHLTGPRPPDLVISISQGKDAFELEEFAGRRRSSASQENLGQTSGGSPTQPIVPAGLAPGAEFLRTSVSAPALKAMRGALGRKSVLQQETQVQDLPPGAKSPRSLPGGPDKSPGLAVEGSGGGFLSNEVFYRNSLLRTQTGSAVPVIHLHTPKVSGDVTDTQRNGLIETVRKILRASLRFI